MNAATATRAPHLPFASLRTTVAAGGWTNGLLLLGPALGPLLAWASAPGRAFQLGLVLCAVCTVFWAMLAGARLVALFLGAWQLRTPRVRQHALACGAAALAMVVVVPALVLAATTSGSFAMAAAVLAAALALGLFWVSMPPWAMWPLLALGVGARWLPGWVDEALLRAALHPGAIALVAAGLLGACAACWAWMAARPRDPGTWSTPLSLTMARGGLDPSGLARQPYAETSLLTPDTPVGSALRRAPQEALAIALGPGFGRHSLRNVLVAQVPIVGVAAFWLLLGTGGGDRPHIGLAFAPLMVLSTAFAPVVRLQTLFWRPALGLHELALLPGLPGRPALSLAAQLGRQAIARALPALAVMAAFGLAVDAPRAYYHLLLWSSAACLFLLSGGTLLSLRSQAGRWACAALGLLLALLSVGGMLVALRGEPPAWLHTAWSAALLAGVVLQGVAQERLKALPHPWLHG